MNKKEKQDKLQKAMPLLIKTYGNQIITKDNIINEYDVVSTGSMALDEALGVGGIIKGRIYELFGMESSGKSTLAQHIIAEFQKNEGLCAYIDVEHAIDPTYATTIGVNLDDLIICQPDSAEDALNLVDDFLNQGVFDLIVLDSVAAMVPKKELEGDIGDSNMGILARLMSQALRKIVPAASNNNCAVLVINQMRNKLGIMFGSPLTTPGGEAMKFASSVRMQTNASPNKETDGSYESTHVKVKVLKNKLAAPFKIAEFDVVFGEGIDKYKEILDKAIEKNIIIKGGAWLTYGENKVQGMDKFKQLMQDNEELTKELKDKICGKEQ